MAIGKGGTRLKYLQKKYKVKITVPKDRVSALIVSGESANVQSAIKELEELVEGDLLKQHVVVEGPLTAAQKAVASIETHVAERCRRIKDQAEKPQRREELVDFPVCIEPDEIPKAIGKGGFRTRHVARRHNVKIQLPKRDKPDAPILVTGPTENVLNAMTQLELMVNHLKLAPAHVLLPLRLDRDDRILLLGPASDRVAQIEQDLGHRFVR